MGGQRWSGARRLLAVRNHWVFHPLTPNLRRRRLRFSARCLEAADAAAIHSPTATCKARLPATTPAWYSSAQFSAGWPSGGRFILSGDCRRPAEPVTERAMVMVRGDGDSRPLRFQNRNHPPITSGGNLGRSLVFPNAIPTVGDVFIQSIAPQFRGRRAPRDCWEE